MSVHESISPLGERLLNSSSLRCNLFGRRLEDQGSFLHALGGCTLIMYGSAAQ